MEDQKPRLNGMKVIAITKRVVYVRLPPELQRDCGDWVCDTCKEGERCPHVDRWDTLSIPIHTADLSGYKGSLTWTCHLPDKAVAAFVAYIKQAGL